MGKRRDGRVTLVQFVAESGTQYRAAQRIGCRAETLNRWLNRSLTPRALYARKLHELGIDVLALGVTEQEVAEFETVVPAQ